METISLKKPVELVMASSKMTANTTVVVGDVKNMKEKDPKWFDGIVKEYQEVITQGREALVGDGSLAD